MPHQQAGAPTAVIWHSWHSWQACAAASLHHTPQAGNGMQGTTRTRGPGVHRLQDRGQRLRKIGGIRLLQRVGLVEEA